MKTNIVTKIVYSIAALLTSAACSNNGSSGSSPAPAAVGVPFSYYGAAGCATCTSVTQGLLISTISRDYVSGTGAEMDLHFYGSPALLAQVQGYQSSGYALGFIPTFPNIFYAGPFAGSGYLTLPAGLPNCGIPAGRYQLQTSSAGVWGNDGAGRSGEGLTMGFAGSSVPVGVYLSGYTMPLSAQAQGQDGNVYYYGFQTTTLVIARSDMPAYSCQLYLQ